MSVVVVGGGLSGLFCAISLIAAGEDDVVVVEKSEHPGGVADTIRREGFSLEPAVGSMTLPHPHLSPILDLIGAEIVAARPEAAARHLYVGDRLVEVPASPRALLAPVVSWRGRLRALLEAFSHSHASEDDETVTRFCTRHFGEEAGRLAAWLMASGVFAGDPDRISAQAAFPPLVAIERENGSLIRGVVKRRRNRPIGRPGPAIHHPAGGMAALTDRATRFLGDRYRGGFEVTSVRREGAGWVVEGPDTIPARSVVVSAPPDQAEALVDDELGRLLRAANAAPAAVVGLGGVGEELPRGFGALIGPDEGLASLGMLFESSYAPERAPEGSWLIKVIAGGATRPEVVAIDGIGELVREEAELVIGRTLEPTFVEVVRHHPGIPQYDVGHLGWLAAIDDLLAERPGLHLTGWGYRGVGIGHLATDAARLATRLTDAERVP